MEGVALGGDAGAVVAFALVTAGLQALLGGGEIGGRHSLTAGGDADIALGCYVAGRMLLSGRSDGMIR